jgi:uncharacterized protein involved in exopolysaccharide biosynthesis
MEITLHDFFAMIKDHEYLIAVFFLLLFVGFWTYLFKKPEKQDQ